MICKKKCWEKGLQLGGFYWKLAEGQAPKHGLMELRKREAFSAIDSQRQSPVVLPIRRSVIGENRYCTVFILENNHFRRKSIHNYTIQKFLWPRSQYDTHSAWGGFSCVFSKGKILKTKMARVLGFKFFSKFRVPTYSKIFWTSVIRCESFAFPNVFRVVRY